MPRLAHCLDGVARRYQRADEVGFDGREPMFHFIAVRKRRRGVIHQRSERAELAGGECHQIAYLSFLPHIGGTEDCAPSRCLDEAQSLLAAGNIDIGDNYRGAFAGEPEGNGAAASHAAGPLSLIHI